jgi:general secretion pathway protein B
MSSILKALKKLEDEKNAKQGHRVDITRDIFGGAQQPPTVSRWPLIAGSIAGSITLCVAVYLFMARPAPSPAPPPLPAETRRNETTPSSPAVESPTALSSPQEKSPNLLKTVELSAPPASPKTLVTTMRAATQSVTPKVSAHLPSPTISANRPVFSNPPPLPQLKSSAVPAATTLTTPRISVSGIAYNKDAADRLAFINGAPAGEGKTVSGVTVEEILPDKVRFSYGQKSFEVLVGKSNQ